jgi:hypothetical protein
VGGVEGDNLSPVPDLRLGATPDFWVNDDGLLQAKTVNSIEWERWQGRPPTGGIWPDQFQEIVGRFYI